MRSYSSRSWISKDFGINYNKNLNRGKIINRAKGESRCIKAGFKPSRKRMLTLQKINTMWSRYEKKLQRTLGSNLTPLRKSVRKALYYHHMVLKYNNKSFIMSLIPEVYPYPDHWGVQDDKR